MKHRRLLGYERSLVGETLNAELPALSTSPC
jgi:hypothetical protein